MAEAGQESGQLQVVDRPKGGKQLRGRHAGYVQPDWVRGRIQTTMVLQFLHRVVEGKVDAHPAQIMARVAAAKLLLDKSLPSLQAVALVNDAERRIEILTRME